MEKITANQEKLYITYPIFILRFIDLDIRL